MKEIKNVCLIPGCGESLASSHKCICSYHWGLLSMPLREELSRAYGNFCKNLGKPLKIAADCHRRTELRDAYTQSVLDSIAYIMATEFTAPTLEWDEEGRMTLYVERTKKGSIRGRS